MIEVIVFSHRRPLQLHGYLESLRQCVFPEHVSVIYHEGDYRITQQAFPEVNWRSQGRSFDYSLRQEISAVRQPLLMFGCDDVAFFRQVFVEPIDLALRADERLAGYSLRLGPNVRGYRGATWDWREQIDHWGYPLELTGTVYRTSDVRDVIRQLSSVACPNHFEAAMQSVRPHNRPLMRCGEACCISLMVNQVQTYSDFRLGNPDGHGCWSVRPEWSVKRLDQAYRAGFRLDWRQLSRLYFDNIYTTHYLPLRGP